MKKCVACGEVMLVRESLDHFLAHQQGQTWSTKTLADAFDNVPNGTLKEDQPLPFPP